MFIYKKIDVCGDCHPILWKCMKYVFEVYIQFGCKRFFITSIRDGLHSLTSFHYIGRAIDFERQTVSKEAILKGISHFCSDHLQCKFVDFDLIEYPDKDIFHLELDPK